MIPVLAISTGLALGLAIAGLLGFIIFLIIFKRTSGSPNDDPSDFAATVFHPSHRVGTTPKGAAVFSYMPRVSGATMERIDAGMQRTFDIVRRHHGYTNALNHSDYWVSVWPRSSKCEGPGFLMSGSAMGQGGYDGTDYDKDPRPGFFTICVAGEFRVKHEGDSPASPRHLAISVVDDPEMTFNAARAETEHGVALENDPELYGRTWDHSQGGGHWIFPDPEGEGLALQLRHFSCTCQKPEK